MKQDHEVYRQPQPGSAQRGRRWRGWLAAGLAMWPLSQAIGAETLESQWRDSQSREYQQPTAEELARAEALFRRAFAGESGATLAADWAALGLQIASVTENDRVFTVIREKPDQRRGRGFYAFTAPAPTPVLQAPHALSDQHTGVIAMRLFRAGRFAAGAWSTAPRSYEDDEDETVNADMARRPDSYFIAFSHAAAAQSGRVVVQLHGFAAEKRKTEAGRTAGAIVSAGQSPATPASEQTARCLSGVFTEPVLLYPNQINDLGALVNPVGKALRALGNAGFVHIELALPVREQLRNDAGLRGRFGTCLAGVRS